MSRLLNTFLLVVVCCFTKYCLLFPLRRATSKVVAQRLEDHVFLVHGIPRTVIADNGPQFIGHEVKELFGKYRIPQVHYTPVYCPQVNTVERYNRTVMTAVSTLVGSDHRTWDVNIPKIQFALNTAVNDTTSFSPFLLVHGREAIADGSVFRNASENDLESLTFGSREEYAESVRCLKNVFTQVKLELAKAHERNVKHYNRRHRDVTYQVGDRVWKRTYKQSSAAKHFSAKLAPKFERCKVVRRLSPLVYELEDENGRNIGKWHVKDFKSLDAPS